MKLLTLLTDFGLQDGYSGIMKGVIWKIAPQVQITDLSHNISPQNIMEGALTLQRAAHYFPEGTIHIAVVDPDVGTKRRPIAARLGTQYYVAPDNGLLSLLLEEAEQKKEIVDIIHLNQRLYWLPTVSHSFHGRDIFAPVGAHLANGVSFSELGSSINDPVRCPLPKPEPSAFGWRGEIIHIDHFGNLATNITSKILQRQSYKQYEVRFGTLIVQGIQDTFGESEPGDLVALFDSSGYLSLNIVNGNAAREFDAYVGDEVEIYLFS